jgi:hypothetical protein
MAAGRKPESVEVSDIMGGTRARVCQALTVFHGHVRVTPSVCDGGQRAER